MTRKPTLPTKRSFVLEQERSLQNASTRTCLRSGGTSPEFRQRAMPGASSSMTVRRSFRFSPTAASIDLSSLFIIRQTLHSWLWHLLVTELTSPPSSSRIQYGQFASVLPCDELPIASARHMQSAFIAAHTLVTPSHTVLSRTCR